MTQIILELPDELAKRALEAKLFSNERFSQWVEAELRREALQEMVKTAEYLSDYPDKPTPEEIQEVIDQVRRES